MELFQFSFRSSKLISKYAELELQGATHRTTWECKSPWMFNTFVKFDTAVAREEEKCWIVLSHFDDENETDDSGKQRRTQAVYVIWFSFRGGVLSSLNLSNKQFQIDWRWQFLVRSQYEKKRQFGACATPTKSQFDEVNFLLSRNC